MDPVAEAFAATPREDFLPVEQRRSAAHDGPLPIGRGQTNSQPRTVETMLRLLDVHPGNKVLDVGAGSGWTTALLARLTGPNGRVLGVELEPELVELGRRHLAGAGLPWADIHEAAPGVLGLPDELVDQLHTGGVMVVPVKGTMLRVARSMRGTSVTRHGSYRFVPLR